MNIRTIGDLRKAISHMNDDDLVVMETTDLSTGDAIDLFPFYVDVIDGIELKDGSIVSEIRFCQMPNEYESVKLFSHVDGNKVTGTSWHGAIVKASVNELTGILGDPSCVSNNGRDKTNFEWWMETTNGDAFTIYDWKEYRVLDLDEPIEWHIGCHTRWVGASVSNLIMAELVRKEVGDGNL